MATILETYAETYKSSTTTNYLPRTAEYLQRCITDTAHIPRQKDSESTRAYKRRIYHTLCNRPSLHSGTLTPLREYYAWCSQETLMSTE
jgi:hypothetical protein